MKKKSITLAMNDPSCPSHETVEAHVFGNWAAHRSMGAFGYSVTFIPFGLCAPYSFFEEHEAEAAAQEFENLREDWLPASVEKIRESARDMRDICEKYDTRRTNGQIVESPVELSGGEAA